MTTAVIPESARPNLERNPETGEWSISGYSIRSPLHDHVLTTRRKRSGNGHRLHVVECSCGWNGVTARTVATAIKQALDHHFDRIPPSCPNPNKLSYKTEATAHRALLAVWRKTPNELLVPIRAYECRCRKWHLTSKEER